MAVGGSSQTVPSSAVAEVHDRFLRQQLRYRTWRTCGHRYAASIDPDATIDLDPEAITYALTDDACATLESSRDDVPDHVQSVAAGDWDLETDRFVETPFFRALRSRFVDGVSWRTIAEERPELVSPDSLESRETRRALEALEVCYADVATGYRSVRERRNARRVPPDEPSVFDPYPSLPPAKAEIRVDVGRDGRFVLHSGAVRLALARLLEVDAVPVHVFVRHERWQARRDRVVLTGSDAGDHPDLGAFDAHASQPST